MAIYGIGGNEALKTLIVNQKNNRRAVVVYGNCHTEVISRMLESWQAFNEQYYIVPTKRIQEIKDPRELYEEIYSQCDVFIHQSIRLNNRYGEDFASERIIARLKPECQVISIPNVYHLPLCFFPQYSDAQELRRKGVTFFFRDKIIDSHLDHLFKLSSLVKLDYENPNYYNFDEIVDSFRAFIEKVRQRETDWDIKVSGFILDNYKSHQLFYDPNHPTNYFLSYITTELLKRLIVNSTVTVDQLRVACCLDTIEIPVCAAVTKALHLDWTNSIIRISGPFTNRLRTKMNINNYIYQYLSCVWLVKDYPSHVRLFSCFLWVLNTMVYFVHKATQYLFRKTKK